MGFQVVRAERLDEKGVGEAALPCPLGQGALSGRGATLLACGKGASGKARAGFFRLVCLGQAEFSARKPPRSARAGLTGADDGFLPHPGCFRFRRGHGGLRPHPLKGLVP